MLFQTKNFQTLITLLILSHKCVVRLATLARHQFPGCALAPIFGIRIVPGFLSRAKT